MVSRSPALPVVLLTTGLLTLAGMAGAIAPKQSKGLLESLAFVSEHLQAGTAPETLDDVRVTAAAGIASTWDSFRVEHGDWSAIVDQRTGKIEIAEGEGIPFVPGHGNQLQIADISAGLGDKPEIDLATMESITRAFLPRVAGLLGVDPSTLTLNQGRSGHPADYLWFVDFDMIRDGLAVEGARVVFRVNNGNLVQFGSENLPAEGAKAPKAKLTRNQALQVLSDYIGGFGAADSFLDGGSEGLVPVALADSRFADGFELGKGRGLARIWQFIFRRDGDSGTWRARVDATSGKLLELRDLNAYAQVTGGVDVQGRPIVLPMPFADVRDTTSSIFTNSGGTHTRSGGRNAFSSRLNGQYVQILDQCGPISQASNTAGNVLFGASASSDCATPGHGGAGNTYSSRTQFYHLNRAKEAARGWLPGNSWLGSKLTAEVNFSDTCNAYWNPSDGTVNFFMSGGGCGNSGEIEAVSLHEYGHGLDTNDGNGFSPEGGTAESYGDWTAALATHNSCIGAGFYISANCGGYGDPCTSCSGLRDIDWGNHTSKSPHTVSNFTQGKCFFSEVGYIGPCGREGHCESYIASEALWDFINRDLPSPGSNSAWAIADRLWYLSRSTASSAFTCTANTSPWKSSGCGTGSLWKTLRAVDDDDGNLANGTPSSVALFAAFNRHGIACPSDAGASISRRGCTQPVIPTISLAAAGDQVTVKWPASAGVVYDIYRNERGCNAAFLKIANDVNGAQFVDNNAAAGVSYYYQVVAQPLGRESCASAPSLCAQARCTPPLAPTGLTAVAEGGDQINLSWGASTGATEYHIYRVNTSNGAYTLAGTTDGFSFSDTDLSCNTTYSYVVRAATCESVDSIRVAATTGICGARTLAVSKNGTGTGTVTSSPAGINCGQDCREYYAPDTLATVTLTATPAAGSIFSGWGGACNSAAPTCTVQMDRTRTVRATFSSVPVTVTKRGNGFGTVTSTPAGIDCGTDCKENYPPGTSVTLRAVPAPGSDFSGWDYRHCRGTAPTCTLTLDQKHTREVNVTATFSTSMTLAVAKTGNGSGTVTSTPAGINCGADCSENYPANTFVTLSAVSSPGSSFSGWSEINCRGTAPTCTVRMDRSRQVMATFSIKRSKQ
jgi:hypothetical protein